MTKVAYGKAILHGEASIRQSKSIDIIDQVDIIEHLRGAIGLLSDLTDRGGSCVVVLEGGSGSQQMGRFDQAANIDRYYRSFERDFKCS